MCQHWTPQRLPNQICTLRHDTRGRFFAFFAPCRWAEGSTLALCRSWACNWDSHKTCLDMDLGAAQSSGAPVEMVGTKQSPAHVWRGSPSLWIGLCFVSPKAERPFGQSLSIKIGKRWKSNPDKELAIAYSYIMTKFSLGPHNIFSPYIVYTEAKRTVDMLGPTMPHNCDRSRATEFLT